MGARVGEAAGDALRRVFDALGPVVVLEVAAALLVVGLASSLAAPRLRRPVTLPPLPRVPAIAVLAVVVVLAALFRAALGDATHLPQVLGDELIYTGLAKGWALHGEPVLRGSVEVGYSTLYPLFLAPAFALAPDGATALEAARALNAVAMASAAVPAYMLARRIVSSRWALVVAALTAFVPWTAYAALTMTEALFYPVFVAYAAALAWMLERPTWRRQAAALALLAALVGVRTQGLAVALGTVAAVLLHAALAEDRAAALRRFAPTFGALAAVVVGALAARAAGATLPTGTYDPVFDSLAEIGAMLEWAFWNVAAFALALGVVALAAFPLALRTMLRGAAPPAARATGVVALTLGLALLGSVALLSASPYGLDRLHERSLFYAAPLVLVCLAYWLTGGLERPRWLAPASAGAAVAVVATLPWDVVTASNTHDLLSSAFFLTLDAELPEIPFRVWTIAVAVAGAGTALVARRALFPLLSVILAFVALTASVDYADTVGDEPARALSWVDRALPPGERAALIHLGLSYGIEPCASAAFSEQHQLVIWTEYFNTRIEPVRFIYEPNHLDGFGHRELVVGEGGLLLDEGRPFDPAYAILDSRQPVTGAEVTRFDLAPVKGAARAGASLTLWRVDPPLRLYPLPQPQQPRPDGQPC